MTYLEVKRALRQKLPEIRGLICYEVSSALGQCRDCRYGFHVHRIGSCKADGHSQHCLELDFTCRCQPHGVWHMTKLEAGNLVLEAPE